MNQPPIQLLGFARIDAEVIGWVHRTWGAAPGCVISHLPRLGLGLMIGDVSAIGIPLGHALTRIHGIRLVDMTGTMVYNAAYGYPNCSTLRFTPQNVFRY